MAIDQDYVNAQNAWLKQNALSIEAGKNQIEFYTRMAANYTTFANACKEQLEIEKRMQINQQAVLDEYCTNNPE